MISTKNWHKILVNRKHIVLLLMPVAKPFLDVPCHRVTLVIINSGFSMRGGVSKKKELLLAEGIIL